MASQQLSAKEVQDLTSAIKSLENVLKKVIAGGVGVGEGDGIIKRKPQPMQSSMRMLSMVGMGSLENDLNTTSPEEDAPKLKRQVFIRVVFMKIGEIDTVNEKFSADIFIHGRWREKRLDNSNTSIDDINWSDYWSPKLFILNYLGAGKEEMWRSVSYDAEGQATVYEKHRVTGPFLEYLELKQFPFDTQDLSVTVSSNKGVDEVDLLQEDKELCAVNTESFVDMQEWHLHKVVYVTSQNITKAFHSEKHKHPALKAAVLASRRPGFFIWNVLILMLFICSLSFSIFAVNIELIPNRLQLSFILLLTTVTFKFVVTHNLPKMSYTTYLDKYILSSMIYLCLITVWHVIAFLLDKHKDGVDDKMPQNADSIAFYILISLWVIFQIFFFSWVTAISHYNKKYIPAKLLAHGIENLRKIKDAVSSKSTTQTHISQDENSSPSHKQKQLSQNSINPIVHKEVEEA